VVADQALSVTIAAYVAKANILAHRSLTTSEIFPANQQDVALQRLIDQNDFYEQRYLTDTSIDILRRYSARYIVVASGSGLDLQLRLAPKRFEWLTDDESYSLFAVRSCRLPVRPSRAITPCNKLSGRQRRSTTRPPCRKNLPIHLPSLVWPSHTASRATLTWPSKHWTGADLNRFCRHPLRAGAPLRRDRNTSAALPSWSMSGRGSAGQPISHGHG